MKQKGLAPILIVALVATIAGLVLLVPFPYYQNAYCNEMYPPKCYPAGWKLKPPLWQKLLGIPTQTVSYTPTYPSPSSIPTTDASGAPNGAVETANWKTYSDSSFTFKYPNNWYSESNPNYPSGEVSFFLMGTKADHGYGDHKGNEVFSFEFSEDERSLEMLKKDYYPDATDFIIDGKQAIKTSFNLIIVKPSENSSLSIVGGFETAKPYLNQILSTFRFIE